MHEEMKSKMREISDTKERLMAEVHSKVASGLKTCDVKEAGEIVDMIKDLADTEKNCWEACYYETVVKAMEEKAEDWDDEPMGYNPNRAASGRYTTRSGRSHHGGRMGYRPMVDEEPYIREYLDHPDEFRHRMMGYRPMEHAGMGDMNREARHDERYGQAYRKYKEASLGYTSTKSPEYRDQMRTSAQEHIADTMITFRDMWSMADPELKKQMKTDLTKLVGELNV